LAVIEKLEQLATCVTDIVPRTIDFDESIEV